MKRIIYVSLFLTFLANQVLGQIYLTDISGSPISERNLVELGGSPYFNDEFLKGAIKMEDNSVFKDIYLRYDLESDQLVYRKPNTSTSMLPNGKVVGFSIEQPNGITANFKGVFKGDKNIDGFYQLLHEGKFSLLKKTKKKIVEKVEYNSTSKSKFLATSTNYYIQKSSGDINFVKADKKSFIKILGRETEINDFVAKHSINLKNESDMIKLVAFLNSEDKTI